jgi:chitinase
LTCFKTYTVVNGDYCSKVWTSFGLSEAQFRALNPFLKDDCDLDIGQVLCVAGPNPGTTPMSSPPPSHPTTTSAPTTCGKTYTVVSGDYCSKICDTNGLT